VKHQQKQGMKGKMGPIANSTKSDAKAKGMGTKTQSKPGKRAPK
jgi:hypothetical protein